MVGLISSEMKLICTKVARVPERIQNASCGERIHIANCCKSIEEQRHKLIHMHLVCVCACEV